MSIDRTFCASPNCKNKCGRKLAIDHRDIPIESGRSISFAYFCGEPKADCEHQWVTASFLVKGCRVCGQTSND